MADGFTKDHIAPDSRLQTVFTPRGAFQGEFFGEPMWLVPTYCLNCGLRGPDTPQENMRHFSYLCNGCVGKYGAELGTLVIPDQVFWEAVRLESLETFGRELTHQELVAVAATDASPLATLLHEHP